MQKTLIFAVLFSISLFLSSCLITTEPYRKTRIFDLGHIEPSELSLKIDSVENPNLYRHQFVYRVGENEIEMDDFNRWVALPENMLYSRLKTVFRQSTDSPILNVKILKFEFDKLRNVVCFRAIYSIRTHTGELLLTETFDTEKKLEKFSPELFASEMTDLTRQFIDRLKQKRAGF